MDRQGRRNRAVHRRARPGGDGREGARPGESSLVSDVRTEPSSASTLFCTSARAVPVDDSPENNVGEPACPVALVHLATAVRRNGSIW